MRRLQVDFNQAIGDVVLVALRDVSLSVGDHVAVFDVGTDVYPATVRAVTSATAELLVDFSHALEARPQSIDGVSPPQMLSAQQLAAVVWANNTASPDGDAVADVRLTRNADRTIDDLSLEMQSSAQDDRTEEQRTEDLMASLGLNERS